MKWLITAALAVALYAIYPFATMLWIGYALAEHNAATLDALVDWPGVRESMRITATAAVSLEIPHDPVRAAELVNRMVDDFVSTPGVFKLLEKRAKDAPPLASFIRYAFFVAPTEFRVDLRPPNKDHLKTLTLIMTLDAGVWKVTQANF